MLTQICQFLKNWFDWNQPKVKGVFRIEDGEISTESDVYDGYGEPAELPLQEGQYFRIIGSVFNDGVYQYTPSEQNLHDEIFDGYIWAMAVPPDVIALAQDIESWVNANQEAINSPYASESFGGYSYTRQSYANATGSESPLSWQSQFSARLAPWRKI